MGINKITTMEDQLRAETTIYCLNKRLYSPQTRSLLLTYFENPTAALLNRFAQEQNLGCWMYNANSGKFEILNYPSIWANVFSLFEGNVLINNRIINPTIIELSCGSDKPSLLLSLYLLIILN